MTKPRAQGRVNLLALKAKEFELYTAADLWRFLNAKGITIGESTLYRYWSNPNLYCASRTVARAIFRGLGLRVSDWNVEENL